MSNNTVSVEDVVRLFELPDDFYTEISFRSLTEASENQFIKDFEEFVHKVIDAVETKDE